MPIRVGSPTDGKRLRMTDPREGTLRAFDFAKREKVGEAQVGRQPIGFVVNPDTNTVLVSVAEDGEIVEVDLESFEVKRRLATGPVPDGIALSSGNARQVRQPAQPQDQAAPPAGQRQRLGVAVESAGIGGGLEILDVVAGSVAEKAGLERGDVIKKLNGQAMDDPEAFVDAIFGAEAGKPLRLTIERDGQEREVEVELS